MLFKFPTIPSGINLTYTLSDQTGNLKIIITDTKDQYSVSSSEIKTYSYELKIEAEWYYAINYCVGVVFTSKKDIPTSSLETLDKTYWDSFESAKFKNNDVAPFPMNIPDIIL